MILLSLFFSEESTGPATRVLLLAGLALVVVLPAFALIRSQAQRPRRPGLPEADGHHRTDPDPVRHAAHRISHAGPGLGFEAILGEFLTGAVLRLIDVGAATVHPHPGAHFTGCSQSVSQVPRTATRS